jgi:hypothetical protein
MHPFFSARLSEMPATRVDAKCWHGVKTPLPLHSGHCRRALERARTDALVIWNRSPKVRFALAAAGDRELARVRARPRACPSSSGSIAARCACAATHYAREAVGLAVVTSGAVGAAELLSPVYERWLSDHPVPAELAYATAAVGTILAQKRRLR